MFRHPLTCAFPCLALFILPVIATCNLDTTVVGEDGGGVTTRGDDGGATKTNRDDGGVTTTNGDDAGVTCKYTPPCAPLPLPVGCTWGPAICAPGATMFSCPTIVSAIRI